jgi:hypothetical protein
MVVVEIYDKKIDFVVDKMVVVAAYNNYIDQIEKDNCLPFQKYSYYYMSIEKNYVYFADKYSIIYK